MSSLEKAFLWWPHSEAVAEGAAKGTWHSICREGPRRDPGRRLQTHGTPAQNKPNSAGDVRVLTLPCVKQPVKTLTLKHTHAHTCTHLTHAHAHNARTHTLCFSFTNVT